MVEQKRSTHITLIRSHPVHLFVGSAATTLQATQTVLQQLFCASGGCAACVTCTQITSRQHPSCLFLAPEKGYTTEHLEELFHTVSFGLADDEYYFFILQKAETLNPASAHSLLKLLEEPPRGYRFILHTTNVTSIMPTIRSRSIITNLATTAHEQHHPIYQFFTSKLEAHNLIEFMSALQSAPISEHESAQLLDALIAYWNARLEDEYMRKKVSRSTQAVLQQLTQALAVLPMPGSSKLFWHNLFLCCIEAQ